MCACAVWAAALVVLFATAQAQQEDTASMPNEIDNTVFGEDECEAEPGPGVACKSHDECAALGQRCCGPRGSKTCALAPKRETATAEQAHAPFLGLIPRECPKDPMPEPFLIRNCSTDTDCWPRICCPDGEKWFCRTAMPLWDRLPAQRLLSPVRSMLPYLQCTPPPPPLYDLFPKTCRSTLDCFPNLCCQEQDRRVCRPPRKSVLALLSMFGQIGLFISQERFEANAFIQCLVRAHVMSPRMEPRADKLSLSAFIGYCDCKVAVLMYSDQICHTVSIISVLVCVLFVVCV